MCGIVAYLGSKSAKDFLLEGLHSLEYRGYDSSGIALLSKGKIQVVKSAGKLNNLELKINDIQEYDEINSSTCGIGHTRWATHGKASDINAHPHLDSSANLVLVHNGIIKNYYQIKKNLENDGVKFISETDSEVILKLLAKIMSETKDEILSLQQLANQLEGSYSLAIMRAGIEEVLLLKNQTPLVIGLGEGENFAASDSATVLQYTSRIIKLKDLQIAKITRDSVAVYDPNGKALQLEVHHLTQSASVFEKGPYKHFLLKEIFEQAGVASKMLMEAFEDPTSPIKSFDHCNIDYRNINRIIFVACGSAYHAALIGKYLIELFAKIPVEVNLASEFSNFPVILESNNLVIGISQSGETADTLAAINTARKAGAKVMSITNKVDSAICDLTNPNTYVTPAGIEISVASTKAFSSQVLALYLLAMKVAEDKALNMHAMKQELHTLPLIIDQVIERMDLYKEQFLKFSNYRDFLFLSRGINYPIALEGALKLKELSYIHATGYPSGEMKHGPIAILDQNVPVLSIAIDGPSELEHNIYKKTLSNAEEARARMSPSLILTTDDNIAKVKDFFDEIISIPNIPQFLSPIIANIPLQFLAYFIAEDLGKDIDQPRNLAKSVTVE